MPDRIRRRFSILDAMILVASVAIGLTMVRHVHWVWSGVPAQIAVALSVGLIAGRLRAGRRRWVRLVRQPGFLASLVAALPVLIALAATFLTTAARIAFTSEAVQYPPDVNLHVIYGLIPHLVLATWMVLFLTGRWPKPRDGMERIGRLLGVFWLAYFPISLVWSLLVGAFPHLGGL